MIQALLGVLSIGCAPSDHALPPSHTKPPASSGGPIAEPSSHPPSDGKQPDGKPTDGGADGGQSQVMVVDRHGRQIPSPCAACLSVVDYLAGLNAYRDGGFSPLRSGRIDPASVIPHLARDGLTLKETYHRDPVVVGDFRAPEVEQQLVQRRGKVFEWLTAVGHLYSEPAPQYSKVRCTIAQSDISVRLGWYQLTFELQGGACLLRSLDNEGGPGDDL